MATTAAVWEGRETRMFWNSSHNSKRSLIQQRTWRLHWSNFSKTKTATFQGYFRSQSMMGNINYAEETIDQKPKETQLLYAAANGRIHRLRALLAEGNFGDVDPPNSRAFTPLFLAAKQGHEDCVRALLEAGAQVDGISTNSRNLTPLWVATFAGHDACVKLLVDAGANVAAGFPRNPVHVAAQEGRANCLKLLLDARRAPIPAGGAIKRHSTPLHVACEKGNLECTQLLVSLLLVQTLSHKITPPLTGIVDIAPCILQSPWRPGGWPLGQAKTCALSGEPRLWVWIDPKGWDINISRLISLLSFFDWQIQNGYALDALDTTGLTPLHYTCSNGHQACVEVHQTSHSKWRHRPSPTSPFLVWTTPITPCRF